VLTQKQLKESILVIRQMQLKANSGIAPGYFSDTYMSPSRIDESDELFRFPF
jgi:hypothetical protein